MLMLIELSLLNIVTVIIVGFLFGAGFHASYWLWGIAPALRH